MRSNVRRLAFYPILGALLLGAHPTGAVGAEFSAGGYSFSDELGGFRLLSASGAGTTADPVVVVEEILDPAPITLVIRRQPGTIARRAPHAPLTLVKVVHNRSQLVWAGFELELREVLTRPSSYGDGLSFNQFGAKAPDVSSDAFADNDRIFEPHDRIRFERGFVDPDATARFKVTITDPTPDIEFYLLQDPKLLSAGLPGVSSFAARQH